MRAAAAGLRAASAGAIAASARKQLKALLDFLVESFGGEADWDGGLDL
jgi:hypothetical protein